MIPLNGKTVNLNQLQAEMSTATLNVSSGLGTSADWLFPYDALGNPVEFSDVAKATQVLTAHVPVDATQLRNAVIAQAQSAVGVSVSTLSATQKLALLTCLLYLAGALDPKTLTVQPLNQWLRNP